MQKTFPKTPLSLEEIIIRADMATIKAALEARQKIDELLAEREAAYRRIAELENQVDNILGQPGIFVFPAPPVTVAAVPKVTAAPAAASVKYDATTTTKAEKADADKKK